MDPEDHRRQTDALPLATGKLAGMPGKFVLLTPTLPPLPVSSAVCFYRADAVR